MSQELIIVIALALIFDFLNGMRDASNIVATMISSRAFSPRRALSMPRWRSSGSVSVWYRGGKDNW